jgi:hypothetical protein
MMLIRSAESSRSWIENPGLSPICSACSRSSRAPMPWNVPAQLSASVMIPRILAHHLRHQPLDPALHLAGGAARKGHQQDAARIGAVDDQVRHPVRQGIGLARSGAGNHQQRDGSARMLHRLALLGVELVEIGRGWRARESVPEIEDRNRKHHSCFCSQLMNAGGHSTSSTLPGLFACPNLSSLPGLSGQSIASPGIGPWITRTRRVMTMGQTLAR